MFNDSGLRNYLPIVNQPDKHALKITLLRPMSSESDDRQPSAQSEYHASADCRDALEHEADTGADRLEARRCIGVRQTRHPVPLGSEPRSVQFGHTFGRNGRTGPQAGT